MNTVEELETALAMARKLGYRVRLEWLDGQGGASCEIKGRRWLYVDLALTPREQLEQVLATLNADLTDVIPRDPSSAAAPEAA